MLVRNKWNCHDYKVVEITDNTVTLERLVDYYGRKKGEHFTISKAEYFFCYFEKK